MRKVKSSDIISTFDDSEESVKDQNIKTCKKGSYHSADCPKGNYFEV
jgi:hypothetical protein